MSSLMEPVEAELTLCVELQTDAFGICQIGHAHCSIFIHPSLSALFFHMTDRALFLHKMFSGFTAMLSLIATVQFFTKSHRLD